MSVRFTVSDPDCSVDGGAPDGGDVIIVFVNETLYRATAAAAHWCKRDSNYIFAASADN